MHVCTHTDAQKDTNHFRNDSFLSVQLGELNVAMW